MDIATIKSMLAAKPEAVEEYPFGPSAMVFKVGGKMFAIVGLDSDTPSISLKCDPLEAEALRAEYPAITAGYHLNKRHWNTVTLDGSVPVESIAEMVDASYDLVFQSLPRCERERISRS